CDAREQSGGGSACGREVCARVGLRVRSILPDVVFAEARADPDLRRDDVEFCLMAAAITYVMPTSWRSRASHGRPAPTQVCHEHLRRRAQARWWRARAPRSRAAQVSLSSPSVAASRSMKCVSSVWTERSDAATSAQRT